MSTSTKPTKHIQKSKPKPKPKQKPAQTIDQPDQELSSSIPRSLVLKRGRVGIYLKKLIKEMRILLYPFCAINLKEKNSNKMKDFLSLVDIYGFSHMFAFTNTEKNSYLKLAKLPSGPTITFKINKYCLAGDIFRENENDGKALIKLFNHTPICILNGFNNLHSKDKQPYDIVSTMLQSVFPPIDLNQLKSEQAKKSIFFSVDYNKKGEPEVEMRHFYIEQEKASTKKTISNILNLKKQDLSGFTNIADYILKQSGYTDVSDNEENDKNEENDEENQKISMKDKGKVTIIEKNVNSLLSFFQNEENEKKGKEENEANEVEKEKNGKYKKKEKENKKTKEVYEKQMKVKLIEVGPRLSLRLVKIEEGFFKGNVAYHSLVKRSKKEILEKSKELKEKNAEKQRRREEQEANVKRKEEERLNALPEDKRRIIEEKKNEEEFIGRKRRYEEKKISEKSEKEVVMSQKELDYLKELKKGK